MRFVLQTADAAGDARNCFYPNRVEVGCAEDLQEAVKKDHVCGSYRKDYRSVGNFLASDVLVMDCDNDHTENRGEWITAEKLDELMPDISYAIAFSRNHMRVKDGRKARPKFHVYFPIERTSDAGYYAALKMAVKEAYPFFDGNALDAARFIFGADAGECIWHEGWTNIDEEVDAGEMPSGADLGAGPILEGSRNNSMSHFAGRVLKKYGICRKSKDAFLQHAERCDPPLPEEELDTIWGSAVRFYRNTVMSQPGYVPPDEYNAEFGSLKPEDYSDIGEAKVLVQEYKGELLYTDATDFLSYDGVCWRENKQKAVGAVEEFLDMQLADAREQLAAAAKALTENGIEESAVRTGGKTLEKQIGAELMDAYKEFLSAKSYYAFVMKYRNYKNIVNTQNAAKPMVAADISMFDAQENYLNTPDAAYDLEKGVAGVMPHRSSDLMTKITNASPGEKGKEIWEDALNTFFCRDRALISYVQETVGLAAIGKVYEEALIIAYGEGRNGKSTFWNAISRVMGTYAGTISADALTVGCRRNVKPEVAELKGKRLIIAAELEEGVRLSTSILKQLCSTDQVRGEKKFKDPFDFTPSHTVVLYTNYLPKVGASDDGTWRRLIVIPFHAKIEGSSDVKNYADYLYEHAAPSIMAWIIEGAGRVIAGNHKPKKPAVVENAIEQYRGMNDWMGIFLEECCDVGDGLEQKAGEFYQEYRNFCQRTGEYPRHNSDFASELEKRGFVRHKRRTVSFVTGVKLKDEAVLDFES